MDSDPISESTPKRRKIDHATGTKKFWSSDNDSGDELFQGQEFNNTVPTQILTESQRPRPGQRSGPQLPFTQLMADLQSGPTSRTQTPQRFSSPSHIRSSPSVEVAASSPQRPVSPRFKRPVSSAMAPAGTMFRKPLGVQQKPTAPVITLSDDEGPINHSSDEDDNQASIKPTSFTRGGRNNQVLGVAESPHQDAANKFRSITEQFIHGETQKSRANDSASAYGGQARSSRPQQSRQTGPSKAQPVSDMTIDDITDPFIHLRVERMLNIAGKGASVQKLQHALITKNFKVDDAMDYYFQNNGEQTENAETWRDLASSDLEKNVAKGSIRPVANAKQQVKAPTRSIHEKYGSTQAAKQDVKAPARSIQEKYSSAARPVINRSVSVTSDTGKPRRRLMQGRKRPSSPARSPSPAPEVIELDSDQSGGEDVIVDDESSDPPSGLLAWLNSCSVQELADLANQKEATATLILSHRPFKSIDAIRAISDAQPLKSGKKSGKRAVGDRVMDVCEEMWEGYEAVDQLVEKCETLGEPIRQAMKKWGLDLLAASKDGELGATKFEEAQDSGIGTPSSTTSVDEDVVSPVKGLKKAYLKQPAIMDSKLVMKDYQVFGLNWLNLLWSKRLSCILADDMGLGKTCQVISFLSHLRETGVPGTHLVVVPGSTLENWLREFKRFCPALEVRPYYGSQVEREEQRYNLAETMDEIDVIVTTYDTAVSDKGDNKFLRKDVRPTVCVFDEGHALKNSKSKRHQQLMRIPAKFRLLLTGTPLQNNLQELVSLLNFILPELFTDLTDSLESIFKFKATTTDADHAALLSKQRIQRARSMMTPFVLRRKKQQVLKDIPAKHCRLELCEMVPSQKELWDQTVETARKARLEPGKGKKATVHMTALRFAALHPLLSRHIYTDDILRELQKILLTHPRSELSENRPDQVWKHLTVDTKGGDYGLHKFCLARADYIPRRFILSDDEWMQAGKVQALRAIMTNFIKNGDRVLLFSQFTTMMDILEAVFETLSIKFMRLDGSTDMSTRQDMIDQFTEDESIPVFMLSTKAGGAGINLACANKVIIFDSSFNPQDDIQAENRAHRVGQTREVEVIRLVTKGSIEEQIHALGQSKLALDDRVAGEGASTGDDKAAEKQGEKMVEQMFFDNLTKKEEQPDGDEKKDLKDQFKNGLRERGLDLTD